LIFALSHLTILLSEIRNCTHCAVALQHRPRPIVQAASNARILIIGQAPGVKVHTSGIPWDDASGVRLREWLGLSPEVFYDPNKVALMPMGFCYPGKGESGDLPPRQECAPLWHDRLLSDLPNVKLTVLVGQYAQARYLPSKSKRSMTDSVKRFSEAPVGLFPLPHPSWRSTLWMQKNPWFEIDVLPTLATKVTKALDV
jgi:uracil-DNA glycosylase